MHTPLCNNGENPCSECQKEADRDEEKFFVAITTEEKNAASRERESTLARRVVLHQNGL